MIPRKFTLVPFREKETIPSVLQSSIPDDEKLKRIIALLTTLIERQPILEPPDVIPVQTRSEATTQTPENVDAETVVAFLGKSYRQKGRGLLKFFKDKITWVPHTFEIKLGDKILSGSNIIDLVYYLISKSQTLSPPESFLSVLPVINKLNLPKTLVPEERLKRTSKRDKPWQKM